MCHFCRNGTVWKIFDISRRSTELQRKGPVKYHGFPQPLPEAKIELIIFLVNLQDHSREIETKSKTKMLSLNWCAGQDTSVEVFDGCLGMDQNKMAKPSRLSRQALYASLKEVRIYEAITPRLPCEQLVHPTPNEREINCSQGTPRFEPKFFSSSLFVIRVNLLHPYPSLFLCGLFFY